jgi:hypothetical protein
VTSEVSVSRSGNPEVAMFTTRTYAATLTRGVAAP